MYKYYVPFPVDVSVDAGTKKRGSVRSFDIASRYLYLKAGSV